MKIFEEALNKFLSTTKKIAQHLVKKKKKNHSSDEKKKPTVLVCKKITVLVCKKLVVNQSHVFGDSGPRILLACSTPFPNSSSASAEGEEQWRGR